MTTLKSFQAEIEAISLEKQKQAIRDAKEAHAAAELAKHHGRALGSKSAEDANRDSDSEELASLEVSSTVFPPRDSLKQLVSNSPLTRRT